MQLDIETVDAHRYNAVMKLSVIIPTYKERENVRPLLGLLAAALAGIDWEAVFVDDDSPDGTASEILSLARDTSAAGGAPVRLLRRIGRRGLSSACVEGMLSSNADYFAVIDADMQHDERLLPLMLRKAEEGCDIVVGSRYIDGGGTGDWNAARLGMSRFATRLADLLLHGNRTSDPMSGFFLLRRGLLDEVVHGLSGQGFKILLDILATAPRPLRIGEVAYTFRTRQFGESKLDLGVLADFGLLLADKLIGHFLPARFILYICVGLLGVLIHLGALGLFNQLWGVPFWQSQSLATLAAMVGNFFLNNYFTYADRRIKGSRLLRGLLTYMLICCIGAIPNVLTARYLFDTLGAYWLLAGFLGLLIGSVWNFSVSSFFLWRARR